MLAREVLTLVGSNANVDRVAEDLVDRPLVISLPWRSTPLDVVHDLEVTPRLRRSLTMVDIEGVAAKRENIS
jgi:hypothetical protein